MRTDAQIKFLYYPLVAIFFKVIFIILVERKVHISKMILIYKLFELERI